jgi:hypothetical protein
MEMEYGRIPLVHIPWWRIRGHGSAAIQYNTFSGGDPVGFRGSQSVIPEPRPTKIDSRTACRAVGLAEAGRALIPVAC